MDRLKTRFLSEMGRSELEERSKFVCGDCKYFKTKKCPMDVEYKLANTCYFYKPSKDQRGFLKQLKEKKNPKIHSITMNKNQKVKRKNRLKGKKSNKIFSDEGFIKCNLTYGFRIKLFLSEMIERETWKCQRKGCKDKQLFEVRAKHPTRSYKLNEDLIRTITEVMIELKLVCPGCNFVHSFPKYSAKEIRQYIKSVTSEPIFQKEPENEDEMQMMTRYVTQLAFPDGFEGNPLSENILLLFFPLSLFFLLTF